MTCFRWETKKQIEKLVKTQLLAKGKASKKKIVLLLLVLLLLLLLLLVLLLLVHYSVTVTTHA